MLGGGAAGPYYGVASANDGVPELAPTVTHALLHHPQVAEANARVCQAVHRLGLNRAEAPTIGLVDQRRADFVERRVIKGDVAFKNVTFTYEGQPEPILNDINFSIAAGERLAIVGRIGSGKTTILRLLCGLNPPDKGAVLIDNADIR